MADAIDLANDQAERDREWALAAHQARVAASFAPRDAGVDALCIECEAPIEPERLRVLRQTSRCAACAHDFERRMRGH